MGLRLITAPTTEPITLAEAKSHLRITHSDDDAMLALYISAVRQHIDGRDGWLGRALVTQTWELTLDAFPADSTIRLPFPPLQSVASVKYDNTDGDEVTLSTDAYVVDTASQPGWVVINEGGMPAIWSGINAVKITFVAGYGAAASVPASIKAALLLMLGTLYENRSEVVIDQTAVTIPFASQVLLQPFQVFSHY